MIIRPEGDGGDFEGRDWLYTDSRSYLHYIYRCVKSNEFEVQIQGIERNGGRERSSFPYNTEEFRKRFVENPSLENAKLIRLRGLLRVLRDLVDVSEIHNILVEMNL
jgi:hypothetical protein